VAKVFNILSNAAKKAMPYALYYSILRLQGRQKAAELAALAPALAMAADNAQFCEKYKGRRCFVLCNGPSVKQQDIRALRGEIVFSVSSGYLHPDYSHFQPRFHCVPQVTYTKMGRDGAIAWFNEMHDKLGTAEVFLSHTEAPLVQEEKLFSGRKVHYVIFNGTFDLWSSERIPDLCEPIPRVQSVPIMCLMIALFMGFSEIYLIGTDHDHIRTGKYLYFYEPTVLKGMDTSIDAQGNIIASLHDELQGLARLWRDYRCIRAIATKHGVRIFNATLGGMLDEFPRVSLEQALNRCADTQR
jgi:hypothetical protein